MDRDDLRILRGNPAPDELAALVVVLASLSARAAHPGTAAAGSGDAVVLRWPEAGAAHRPAGAWAARRAPAWRRTAA